MAFLFKGVIQADHVALNTDELSVQKGDKITVKSETDDGWYQIKNRTGKTGKVPKEIVIKRETDSAKDSKDKVDDGDGSNREKLKRRPSTKKVDGAAKLRSSDKRGSEERKDSEAKAKKSFKKSKKDKKEAGKDAEQTTDDATAAGDVLRSSASSDNAGRQDEQPESAKEYSNGDDSSPVPVLDTGKLSPRPPNVPLPAIPTPRSAALNGSGGIPSSQSSPGFSRSMSSTPTSRPLPSVGGPFASSSPRLSASPPGSVNLSSTGSSPSLDRKPPPIPEKRIGLNTSPSQQRLSTGEAAAGSVRMKPSVPMPPPKGRSFNSLRSVPTIPALSETESPPPTSDQIGSNTARSSQMILPASNSPDTARLAASPRPIPDLTFDDEKTKRRYYIVKELLTTERSYVAGLGDGINKFFKPMLEAAKTKAPTMVDDVKSIFSVMEHLLPLNKTLMLGMEDRVINWTPTQRIGDVFAKFAPFLKMYTTYSNNYDTALGVLNKIEKEPFWVELGFSRNAIESILITPIQRLPRYNLLLTDLLSHTSADHVDFGDISKSLSTVRDVAEHVNKGVGVYKNVGRLTEAGLGHLLAPHRTLIKDGTITVVKVNLEKKKKIIPISDRSELKKHQWHFLLFSDQLVYVNQALDENLLPKNKKSTLRSLMVGDKKERKEWIFPLDLVWLADPGLRTGFDLVGPYQTMHLYFTSSAERDEWWQAIETQVKISLEKSEQVDSSVASPAMSQLPRRGIYSFAENDSFEGEWEYGKIQGKGKMTTPMATYIGTFEGTYETGSGSITYPTGMIFTGEWRNGKPANIGEMLYPGQERYVGEFKEGKRSGSGALHYPDGSSYNGEWLNDLPNGIGTLQKVPTDLIYHGIFAAGKFHGAGKLTIGSATYEGSFKENLRNARGKMTYADGSVYDGEWRDDRRYGPGRFVHADGSTYDGEFRNDQRDGRGLAKWPNGDEFLGVWQGGRPHGEGLFTYGKGSVISRYDGDFFQGKRHGKGNATYAHGGKYEGEWVEDLPHGQGKMTLPGDVVIEGKWLAGVATANCSLSVGGNLVTPSATSDESEVQFPQTSEIPLIPSFEYTGAVMFGAP